MDTPEERIAAYDAITATGETASDIQIIHEMAGVDEGIHKYRETLNDEATRLADTPAGSKTFNEVMEDLIPAIALARTKAIEGISNAGECLHPVWWWYISFIAPEKLALITLRSMMGKNTKNAMIGRPATGIFLSIGVATRQQLELKTWLMQSKRAAKETGGRDVAARLSAKSKNFTQRQWINWTRKIVFIQLHLVENFIGRHGLGIST